VSVRVGAVGCGQWGRNVVRDLVALGAIVYVADALGDGRTRAENLGAVATLSAADELPPCDGYVVATPAHAHRLVVEVLLPRGAPIFVEKPPCGDLEDVRALAALAPDRLFVMHKWRYHPGVLAIGEVAREGALGELRKLETTRTGPERLPPHVDVTWHLAVHDLSIALETLGSVPAARTAEGTVTTDGRIGRCNAVLRTDDGIEHVLTVAAGEPHQCRSIRLVGSHGWACLVGGYDDHVQVERQGRVAVQAIAVELPLERELRAFLDHLRGGPAPKSTIGDALALCEELARIDALIRENV